MEYIISLNSLNCFFRIQIIDTISFGRTIEAFKIVAEFLVFSQRFHANSFRTDKKFIIIFKNINSSKKRSASYRENKDDITENGF